ncbi:MAG: hypothetical protein A4E42_00987 [Methanoregulaceae archaeon PtaU1.Bin222]|nr:MAG: hypothetical protein A4E42_00987 [Methanoregulaceae archaeon PtaU1.Bin222]
MGKIVFIRYSKSCPLPGKTYRSLYCIFSLPFNASRHDLWPECMGCDMLTDTLDISNPGETKHGLMKKAHVDCRIEEGICRIETPDMTIGSLDPLRPGNECGRVDILARPRKEQWPPVQFDYLLVFFPGKKTRVMIEPGHNLEGIIPEIIAQTSQYFPATPVLFWGHKHIDVASRSKARLLIVRMANRRAL